MSNQPGGGIPTQITVQNYDQLPGTGELLPLDQQVGQVAVGGRYDFVSVLHFLFDADL